VGPRASLDGCEKSRPNGIFLNLVDRLDSLFDRFDLCDLFSCTSDEHGTDYFTSPSEGRHAVNFSSRKNPTALAGSEPAILGTRGQHANP
jgi:hypothetical protein